MIRPVSALLWATIHAPGAVAPLLARSTPDQIQEALDQAHGTHGWHNLPKSVAKQRTDPIAVHSWEAGRTLWEQAAVSCDPVAAMTALASHPLTLVDRDQRKALETAMHWTNDTHAVLNMLKAGGVPAGGVPGAALRDWTQAPRDLDVIQEGLTVLGAVNQPLDSNGETLLMHAIQEGDQDLADRLLAIGARMDLVCVDGTSVMDLARTAGNGWPEKLTLAQQARLRTAVDDHPAPEALNRQEDTTDTPQEERLPIPARAPRVGSRM